MTYDVRPKRKNRVFEKIQVWYCTTVWCYFLKIFVKRVDHFLGEQLLECSGSVGPHAASQKWALIPAGMRGASGPDRKGIKAAESTIDSVLFELPSWKQVNVSEIDKYRLK